MPEGGIVQGEQLNDRVEDDASALAVVTLSLASLGFLLGVLGLRGGGWCAAMGIVTTLLMARAAFDPFGPEVTFHQGYTFTLFFLIWAAVLHGVRAWRRRRGDPDWTAERA